MTDTDREVEALIEAARAILASRYRPDRHYVGAALSTRSGQVFSAVNLGATVGRASVCAEAVALGMAAAAGDTSVNLIVAVNERPVSGESLRLRADRARRRAGGRGPRGRHDRGAPAEQVRQGRPRRSVPAVESEKALTTVLRRMQSRDHGGPRRDFFVSSLVPLR